MAKYVSKDIICAKMMYCNFRSPNMTVSDFINDELPAADVQPIRRGRWEEIEDYDGDVHYRCTNCKTEFYLEVGTPEYNEYWYCPHCGADMREAKKV